MAERSLRGVRLGAQSLQSEEGVVLMERTSHTYVCGTCGHESTLAFAADAEAPDTWECKKCGAEALRRVDGQLVTVDRTDEKVARTHWDMLLERRTREELEEILQERLAFLRARRGEMEKSSS